MSALQLATTQPEQAAAAPVARRRRARARWLSGVWARCARALAPRSVWLRASAGDCEVFNKAAAVVAETRTVNILSGFLFVTATTSLVVGGIGAMNVMLMTVTERTGEIGVRMAVGASRGDVLAQFLIEAELLACVVGVLGVFAGWAAGGMCRLLDQQVIFTAPGALLAFCCAIAMGLGCGYLPARRAGSLDPVAALARQ